MKWEKKQAGEPAAKPEYIVHPLQWLLASVILIYLFGTLLPVHFTWGFNIWSVFPAPTALSVLILAALLMIIPVRSRFHMKYEGLKQSAYAYLLKNNRYFNLILLSLGLFVIFYIFRSRALVYGDGYLVLSYLTAPEYSFDINTFFMKPLEVLLQRGIFSLLSGFISTAPENIPAIVNAVGGVSGFWALNRIARTITGRDNNHWVIMTGFLGSASVVLFFGYLENYTLVTALSLWSLAFAMGYMKGQNGPLPSVIMGLLAVGFHVLAVSFLIASILAILIKNEKNKAFIKKKPGKIYGVITILSFIIALIFQVLNIPDYIVKIWPDANNRYWFFSVAHLVDILNLLLLVAPVGLIVLLFNIISKPDEKEIEHTEYLLILTALLSFLITFWVNPELGAPRDWDLLSLCGFPLTIWGIYRLSRRYPQPMLQMRFLFPFGLLTLILLVPNLYEKNHLSVAAGRLDRMLWDDAHYQTDYKSAERCIYWSYILENKVGDYARAARYFERNLATDKGGFEARLDWGKMYLEKGLVDSACFWFHAAATIKPDNPEVWYQLSVTEQARGNIATAFSYAEKALAETPYDGNVLTQLGILYQKSGQAQKALQCFRQAYRYEPASYLSALNLGREFQTLKIYDSAVFYMNQSLALSDGILDDDSRFLTQLGYLELGLNQLDSALVHTQLALKVTANDITVNRQLGIILNQMNRNPEALTYFREAYRLSPGSILEIINLGLAFEKSGHYDSAYQYLYKGVEQGGAAVKNPIFYRALFNSCLALGKTDKARQLLNELESFAPDFRDLDEMRRRFKENGG